MITDTDRAYTAGILDGEGSIQINPTKGSSGKRYWGLTIQIASNDRFLLEWIVETFGYGSITAWKSKKSTQGKTSYNWRIHSQTTVVFLKEIIPFMKIKKAQAEIAIEFMTYKTGRGHNKGGFRRELDPTAVLKRNELARAMKLLNRAHGKSAGGEFPEGVI